LRGWDDYSIWGLDVSEATYGLLAQLWRNRDDPDENPRAWITSCQDLETLAYRIIEATGSKPDAVANALLEGIENLRKYQQEQRAAD
jgi:hypothetical protein